MKRTLSLILSLLLCFAACLLALSASSTRAEAKETTIAEDQEELKKLKKELEEIKKLRAESKNSAQSAEKQYSATEQKMNDLLDEIEKLELEKSTTDRIVSEYEDYINKLKESIGEQTVKINELYDYYDSLLVYYYKNGEPSSLELLASADSLSEYLTKKDYVGFILQSMRQKRQEIEAASIDLDNTYADITKSYEKLEEYQSSIQETLEANSKRYDELNEELDSILSDKAVKEEMADSYAVKQAELQKKIDKLEKQIEEKKAFIDPSFCWPIDSVYWKNCYISSGYGYRKDPFSGEKKFHRGVDIAAPYGTPVQVVKSGVVVESTDNGGTSGIYVKVRHYDGTCTQYNHLSKRLVSVGAKVVQGQIIGKVGSTGRSTGNHLHFMVYDSGGEVTNPRMYLDKYILKALDIHHYFD